MQHADMDLDINTAVQGQQYVLGVKHKIAFSLDQQTPQMRQFAEVMLEFLNVVVKSVLRAAQFK
jgi:hypothetical protein